MTIGVHGLRVMAALEEGAASRRSGDGWEVGGAKASATVVARLMRMDLVREVDGGLALTAAGAGWRARRARPDMPNRLLAERALDEARAPGRAGRPARSVTVNLAESPLGWLKARGLVSPRQFEAGERLRGDWTVARLGPRVTMRWDSAPRSSVPRGADAPLDPTLAQIAARRRSDAALAAVGAGLSDVLWRVVCDGQGMEMAEKALGWPARAGRVVLTLALDRLADFYGLG